MVPKPLLLGFCGCVLCLCFVFMFCVGVHARALRMQTGCLTWNAKSLFAAKHVILPIQNTSFLHHTRGHLHMNTHGKHKNYIDFAEMATDYTSSAQLQTQNKHGKT